MSSQHPVFLILCDTDSSKYWNCTTIFLLKQMKREMERLNATRPSTDDDSAQARWRTNIEIQSRKLYGHLRKVVTDIHQTTTFHVVEKVYCDRCKMDKHDLDLVELICCPEKRPLSCPYFQEAPPPPHRVCHSCLSQVVRENSTFLRRLTEKEQKNHEGDEVQTKYVHGLREAKVIACPLCKSPNVLTVQTAFNEGYLRKHMSKDGTITRYQVHSKATSSLRDNFTVEEVYENQRRPIFGSFSASNLRTLDFRGNFSTEKGCELPNANDIEFQKPNKNWVWIELRAPDLTLKKAAENGWMYGTSWADSRNDYDREISLFHFVRTRRLLHTRVRISASVRAELDAIEAAQQ